MRKTSQKVLDRQVAAAEARSAQKYWLAMLWETATGREYTLTYGDDSVIERITAGLPRAHATAYRPALVGYDGWNTIDEAMASGRRFVSWPAVQV